MSIPSATISVPVTCRKCGTESLIDFPILVVVVALTQWNQLALYTHCHDGQWDATPRELDAIRRHLGEAWIEEHRELLGALPSAGPRTPSDPGPRPD